MAVFGGFSRGGLRFGHRCGGGPQWASALRLRAPVVLVDTVDPVDPVEAPPQISHAIPRWALRGVLQKPRNINFLVSMFERGVGELHAILRDGRAESRGR